jgi:tight adherence protein C
VILAIPLLVWSLQGVKPATLKPGRLNKQVRSTLELDPTATARAAETAPAVPPSQPLVDALARGGRRITPPSSISKLERKRQLAGLGSTWSINKLLALKLTTAILGVVFGLFMIVSNPSTPTFLVGALSVLIGFFGPDAWLSRRGEARQAEIGRELADTTDQITICVEAGLGFDAAMARAARSGTGALAEELRRVLQDLQVGVPRSQAFDLLLQRTDVPDLRHFVIALNQAERYGVPIANILRVQAAELREKRKAHAEEEAQKLPIKLLFPLILCVLPVLFIVLMGPAAIRIGGSPLGGS